MKIKELTNAPQWLLDAVVRDEDVEIDKYGRVIWHRGSWDSGDFWGGDFRGGDFRGGNFWGGNFWGEKIKLRPISIYGMRWDVVITDARMKIGCQIRRLCEWEEFDDQTIIEMDGKDALRFWRENKEALLGLARAAGRSFEPVESAE
jgi:hypothetical protein